MNPTGLARVTHCDTVSNQERIISITDLKNQTAEGQIAVQAPATKVAAKIHDLG